LVELLKAVTENHKNPKTSKSILQQLLAKDSTFVRAFIQEGSHFLDRAAEVEITPSTNISLGEIKKEYAS
jgi:hypothetical protein